MSCKSLLFFSSKDYNGLWCFQSERKRHPSMSTEGHVISFTFEIDRTFHGKRCYDRSDVVSCILYVIKFILNLVLVGRVPKLNLKNFNKIKVHYGNVRKTFGT